MCCGGNVFKNTREVGTECRNEGVKLGNRRSTQSVVIANPTQIWDGRTRLNHSDVFILYFKISKKSVYPYIEKRGF